MAWVCICMVEQCAHIPVKQYFYYHWYTRIFDHRNDERSVIVKDDGKGSNSLRCWMANHRYHLHPSLAFTLFILYRNIHAKIIICVIKFFSIHFFFMWTHYNPNWRFRPSCLLLKIIFKDNVYWHSFCDIFGVCSI